MKHEKRTLLDLKQFVASTCKEATRSNANGGLSIINSKNGKRVTLSRTILDTLSHPETVQIAYSDGVVAIAAYIGEKNTNYTLAKSGKKGVIYNVALINELIHRFGLDYNNRTSLTFPIMDVQEVGGQVITYINMDRSDANLGEE